MNTATIVEKIAEDYSLRRRGKLYAGRCPFCGGSKSSDKFNIRPDGGYLCRGCGEKGDIIKWLRNQEGKLPDEQLSCPDAHDRAGRKCRMSSSCPARDKCRYGDKSGNAKSTRGGNRGRRTARPYQHVNEDHKVIPEIVPEFPRAIWTSWMESFVAKCHDQLLQSPEELAYLSSRGIDGDAVDRLSLGWVSHQHKVPKKDIGLEIGDDGKTYLWVPEGLLIPIYDDNGGLHRVRVRRPLAAREKFIPDLKYVWLKGSGNLPMVIMPDGDPRGAVIVEAELDAIAIAAAHGEVISIAVGTLHGGVGPDLFAILTNIPVILVALDAEGKSKKAVDAWKRTFRHAGFWPTPQEKDAGDYFKRGGDLREWIEAGLPPKSLSVVNSATIPTPGSSLQDRTISPGRKHNGGQGERNIYMDKENKGNEKNEQKKQNSKNENDEKCVEITLSNKKVIYLVETKNDVWDRMAAEGKPVFTRHELDKLKAATATMNPEQRIKAAMSAIDAKEVFGGYISRGENHEA